MTIRPGKGLDLKRVVELQKQALSRSRYAGRMNVDEKKAFELFNRACWFHGKGEDGGMYYLVTEVNGQIEGFFLGLLAPVYICSDKLEAQDLLLYTTGKSEKHDAVKMMLGFWDWATQFEKVIEISMSNSDFISGHQQSLARFLTARGFRESNRVFKRSVTR